MPIIIAIDLFSLSIVTIKLLFFSSYQKHLASLRGIPGSFHIFLHNKINNLSLKAKNIELASFRLFIFYA